MASYILAAAMKFSLATDSWRPSFDLAMLGANRALNDFVSECRERNHFIEGVPLVDGYFYGSRQLIIAGLLSAWALRQRLSGCEADEEIQRLILSRAREMFIWGESAAPFVLLTALELERQCKQLVAEGLVADYLQLLLFCHADGMRGLPDAFISIEDSIRFMLRVGEPVAEGFQGFSYTCQAAVDYLARRWRRRTLSAMWEGITRLSLDVSVPRLGWEWFFWKANSAELESVYANQPQSWSTLVADAEQRDVSMLPDLLSESSDFLLFFLLVFPHRLTQMTFALLDKVSTQI